MTSRRQIAANRRNARRSTGPRTAAGKTRSRRNAVKHGLTAETVITVFENKSDYEAFESALVDQHQPRSPIEWQLIVRLASLLWRLRRATAIETGLFSIQAKILRERCHPSDDNRGTNSKSLHELFGIVPTPDAPQSDQITGNDSETLPLASRDLGYRISVTTQANTPVHLPDIRAHTFLRVAHLDKNLFERIGRYETSLWRQAVQLLSKISLIRMSAPDNAKRANSRKQKTNGRLAGGA